MGVWGRGLYEGDEAWDRIATLVQDETNDVNASPVHLAVGLALQAWFDPHSLDWETEFLIRDQPQLVGALPPAAQASLQRIAADPEAVGAESGPQLEEIRAVTGGGPCGLRFDALLQAEGAEPLLRAFHRRCMDAMERAELEIPGTHAPLGLLLELSELGLAVPAERIRGWQELLARQDEALAWERQFYDDYAARVRRGLELLARRSDGQPAPSEPPTAHEAHRVVNVADLARILATRAGISEFLASRVVSAFFEGIQGALVRQERVTLARLGDWSVVVLERSAARHPPRRIPVFRASKALQDVLNAR